MKVMAFRLEGRGDKNRKKERQRGKLGLQKRGLVLC